MDLQDTVITDKLTEAQKASVAAICYSAFSKKFRAFILFDEDSDRGANCIKECINYESGLYALRNEKVLGFIGLEHGKTRYKSYKFNVFRKYYGLWGATWRMFFNTIFILFFDHISKDTVHIEKIAVSDEARGMGIGTKLLNASFEKTRKLKINKITLEVVDTNPRAQKLYENMEFTVIKSKHFGFITASAGFTDVAYMCKKLD